MAKPKHLTQKQRDNLWLNFKQIVAISGMARETVRKYLALPEADTYKRTFAPEGKRIYYTKGIIKYLEKQKKLSFKRRSARNWKQRYRRYECQECHRIIQIRIGNTSTHWYRYCTYCGGDLKEIKWKKKKPLRKKKPSRKKN